MKPVLEDFQRRFESARARAGHPVKLVAVSKGQPGLRIEEFLSTGLEFWSLGESYLEELLAKKTQFQNKRANLRWHFIGRLQSRKLPEILGACEAVHTVSRLKELGIIAKQARDFFVQVNVSGEASKNGCAPADLSLVLEEVARLGLSTNCLGLMALPSSLEEVGESQVRLEMTALRKLRDEKLPRGLLNMGTSGDFEIAISEGADVIRVGSLLFGERV
jgi:pyridoxal phosphate enzyme (YggS family)